MQPVQTTTRSQRPINHAAKSRANRQQICVTRIAATAALCAILSACSSGPSSSDIITDAELDTVTLGEACALVLCDCSPAGQFFVLESERQPVQWLENGNATCPPGLELRRTE